MDNSAFLTRWRSLEWQLLSLLRIVSAFLFIQYGTTKLFGYPAPVMPDGSTAPLWSQAGIAGLLEIVGGTLLLVGLFTRPVAFLVAGEMAFAYFIGHAPQGFWPVLNQGAPAILFCFLWLYISAAGAGPWSIDAMWGRPRFTKTQEEWIRENVDRRERERRQYRKAS